MVRHLLAALVVAGLPGPGRALPQSLVLLGDSITWGIVSEPAGSPYAVLLADSLAGQYDVVNVACGGASSLDWTPSGGDVVCGGVGTVEPDLYHARALPALPAHVVTVLLGTNDAIGFFEPEPVAPEVYRDALVELTRSLLADGAGLVVLMTPPPNFVQPWLMDTLAAYRDQVLDLCLTPGDAVVCGPDLFAILGPEDFGDDIHPNALGHAKIADALHHVLVTAVPEPGGALLLAGGLLALAWGPREPRKGLRS